MKILESASKLVLVMVALTICFGFTYMVSRGQVDGEIVATIFASLTSAVSGYYFAKNGQSK